MTSTTLSPASDHMRTRHRIETQRPEVRCRLPPEIAEATLMPQLTSPMRRTTSGSTRRCWASSSPDASQLGHHRVASQHRRPRVHAMGEQVKAAEAGIRVQPSPERHL